MRFTALSIFALIAFTLSPSHAQFGPSAMEHFEKCPQKPFVKMVECGTKNRQAGCNSFFSGCGEIGNQVVAFTNSLAKSVKSRQLSASAAERQWIQFKMNYYNGQRRSAETADTEFQLQRLQQEQLQRKNECILTPGCYNW